MTRAKSTTARKAIAKPKRCPCPVVPKPSPAHAAKVAAWERLVGFLDAVYVEMECRAGAVMDEESELEVLDKIDAAYCLVLGARPRSPLAFSR